MSKPYKSAEVLFNPEISDKMVHIFPKSISLKVNVITWLEIGLAF